MKKTSFRYLSLRIVFLSFFALLGCGNKNIAKKELRPDPTPLTSIQSLPFAILEVNENGELIQGNKLFYGIGVNYFYSFTRNLAAYPDTDTSYVAGFEYLSNNDIPFIRFSINGFWPGDQELYRTNKQKYFELLDKFIASAERLKIGLIPSFFWNYSTISDIYGEPVRAWADSQSRTVAHMKQFTSEVLTRYKDSKAIWGWEFANEVNLRLDPMGRTKDKWLYSPINAKAGTPALREISDTITTDQFNSAVKEFVEVIRQFDSKRPIFTGNGMAAPNAYGKYFRKTYLPFDKLSEWKEALALQNKNVNTITIHPYPDHEGPLGRYFDFNTGASLMQVIEAAKEASIFYKKPLFIGEFGVSENYSGDKVAKFNDFIKAIVENKVQLSALWVFDFSYQGRDWNVTQTNIRNYQLEAIIAANKILLK